MAVPKLRFKEFDENWLQKRLGSFASKKNLKNRDGLITEVLTNSATQGVIKQSGYFDREIVTESNLNGYYIVNLDDFVYNPRISVHAPVGPIKRNKKCLGVMSPLYTVFKISEGNLQFFEYFFESNFWHDYVKNVSNSGARHDRMNITNKDFFEMPIHLPSLEEQTKLASFLSAVDKKISQLTQKHELLSQYKQGMMQKLFSQQIRFNADDGSEFGEWEDKPLNEIGSKQSGKNKDGSITEVLTNSATQGIIKQSDYFEREIVTESNLNGYYIVNLDDFVYNPRISVHAPVG
ncbi:restriction endonuclease subunit S, partial [Acinetobacter baumannii]|nr:restriction endonuclease subunit S [Acinetobacter baumannii]